MWKEPGPVKGNTQEKVAANMTANRINRGGLAAAAGNPACQELCGPFQRDRLK